jgi:hypothetical protein
LAFTAATGLGVATGWPWGLDTAVAPGVETARCTGFASFAGGGVTGVCGPGCGIGVDGAPAFLSLDGVTALRGVTEEWAAFCPRGKFTVGPGAGPGGDWFCGDFGWPEIVDGVGAIRFGGVPFGVMGDFPGTFAPGGFFS